MRRIAAVLIAAFAAIFALASCSGYHYNRSTASTPYASASPHCGVERWAVKTGTDPGAASVDLNSPQQTTIGHLISLSAPGSLPPDGRIKGAETTEWKLTARLVKYKIEDDSDIHMVISDGARTMIAELPSPGCVGSSSPWLSQITTARDVFDTEFHPTDTWRSYGQLITLTGVGFFDSIHGQTGVAPNGIEIHPVLGWSLAA